MHHSSTESLSNWGQNQRKKTGPGHSVRPSSHRRYSFRAFTHPTSVRFAWRLGGSIPHWLSMTSTLATENFGLGVDFDPSSCCSTTKLPNITSRLTSKHFSWPIACIIHIHVCMSNMQFVNDNWVLDRTIGPLLLLTLPKTARANKVADLIPPFMKKIGFTKCN